MLLQLLFLLLKINLHRLSFNIFKINYVELQENKRSFSSNTFILVCVCVNVYSVNLDDNEDYVQKIFKKFSYLKKKVMCTFQFNYQGDLLMLII